MRVSRGVKIVGSLLVLNFGVGLWPELEIERRYLSSIVSLHPTLLDFSSQPSFVRDSDSYVACRHFAPPPPSPSLPRVIVCAIVHNLSSRDVPSLISLLSQRCSVALFEGITLSPLPQHSIIYSNMTPNQLLSSSNASSFQLRPSGNIPPWISNPPLPLSSNPTLPSSNPTSSSCRWIRSDLSYGQLFVRFLIRWRASLRSDPLTTDVYPNRLIDGDDESDAWIALGGWSVLLQDRSAALLTDLQLASLQAKPNETLLVVYGAGHCSAVQRYLIQEKGYTLEKEQWTKV